MKRPIKFSRHLALRFIVGIILLASVVAPRTTLSATESTVSLPGHVLPNLSSLVYQGKLPSDQTIVLTIVLRPKSGSSLTAVLRQKQSLSGFREGLTPAEVARAVGPSSSTIDAVSRFFQSRGLTVKAVADDHLSFQVQGSASQIESALGASLGIYEDRQGSRFYATSADPQLPADLAPYVQAIFGLDDYPALHPLHQSVPTRVRREGAGSQPGSYTPADMQAAYDLGPLYTQGLNGSNQTIGIIGCDKFSTSDIQTFSSNYGLANPSITVDNVDGGADQSDVETTMDLEWSHAIAPSASLRYYGFPQCSFQGFLDAVVAASNENTAKVISISLGACEADYAQTSYLNAMENQFQVAAAEGQSVLVASGDSGAYCDEDGNGNYQIDVSYPASSAYVTAVGGTSLTLDVNGGYGTETAWGYWYNPGTGQEPWGSGGGYSTVIAEPSWQSQANISDSSGKRAVPDIAWNADPETGNCLYYQGQTQCGWGGTSIAAPQWAGLIAIAGQAANHPFGQVAALLYNSAVLNTQSTASPAYHDVTSGDNLNYSAGTGWDAATGWGSADGYNLVMALKGLPVTFPPATPTSTPISTAVSSSCSSTPGCVSNRVFVPFVSSGAFGALSARTPFQTPTGTPTSEATTPATAAH